MNQQVEETASEKKVGYTTVFARNRASKATVIINVGGARSGKSYAIAQLLIEKLLNETNKVIGICRKTFPALRMSAMKIMLDLLKDYGIYRDAQHNKTFNTYTYGTNLIQFFGLDESEKVKSTEFNYIHCEEGNEFSYEDYIALKLRLSGKTKEGEQNHIYISLNPVDAHNWIATRATKETDVEVIKSTYLDNPYLSQAYIDFLTDLINQDENSYRVYVLGEWGLLEGKIYTNYKLIPEMPLIEKGQSHWAYGLDFGDACSTLIKVTLFKDRFYLEEQFYKSGWTNADIIEALSHVTKGDIYGDPTSKQAIKEIGQAGYSAFEGIRGVKESIDLCKRQTLYITEESVNLIREIQNYHRKKNPLAIGTEDSFLDEPVKFHDHACDAFRYAIWGITSRFGFPTQRPRSLEPIQTLHFEGKGTNRILERWLGRTNG